MRSLYLFMVQILNIDFWDGISYNNKKQERKTFIRSEAITMSYMIVIPENHSSRDETDYIIS